MPQDVDLDTFAAEARAFLDAHASRRAQTGTFTWGEGSDYVGFFGDPLADEQADLAAARRGNGRASSTASGGSPARPGTAAATSPRCTISPTTSSRKSTTYPTPRY